MPSTASVSHVRDVVGSVSTNLRQATIQVLTSRQTGKKTVEVQATTKQSSDPAAVNKVTMALAKMAGVSANDVTINSVGPSWGHDITDKAVRALIVFFIVIAVFVWFWFEPKMAVAALDRRGPRHDAHRRDLLAVRLPGEPGHGHRLPHHPRLLALRHHRRLRQDRGEHEGLRRPPGG